MGVTTQLGAEIAARARYWLERDCYETRPQGGGCVDEIHVAYNAKMNREAWCAKFVYVCVKQACANLGVVNALPQTPGARDMLNKSRGKLPVDLVPRIGSVGYRHTTAPDATGHMMIVVGVDAYGIVTIEGNAGDRVAAFGYQWSEIRDMDHDFHFIHAETIGGTSEIETGTERKPVDVLPYVAAAAVITTVAVLAYSS